MCRLICCDVRNVIEASTSIAFIRRDSRSQLVISVTLQFVMVLFPAAEFYDPLSITKLYHLMTEVLVNNWSADVKVG